MEIKKKKPTMKKERISIEEKDEQNMSFKLHITLKSLTKQKQSKQTKKKGKEAKHVLKNPTRIKS